MAVDVPERIVPVAVVEVRIASEHLLDDALAVLVEVLWEATRSPDPVVASKSGQGRIEAGGTHGNRGCGSWCADIT